MQLSSAVQPHPRDSPTVSRELMINFIPNPIQDQELHRLFSEFGELEFAKVITDKFTGYPKGYGFVKYRSISDAVRALQQMNGYPLLHKRLKVSYAIGGPNDGGETVIKTNSSSSGMPPQYGQQQQQQQEMVDDPHRNDMGDDPSLPPEFYSRYGGIYELVPAPRLPPQLPPPQQMYSMPPPSVQYPPQQVMMVVPAAPPPPPPRGTYVAPPPQQYCMPPPPPPSHATQPPPPYVLHHQRYNAQR